VRAPTGERWTKLRVAVFAAIVGACIAALVALGLATRIAVEAIFGEHVDPDARIALRIRGPDAVQAELTLGQLRRELAWRRFERAGQALGAPRLPEALKDAAIDALAGEEALRLEAERRGVRASTTAVARELARITAELGEDELARRLAATYQTRAELVAATTARLTRARLVRDVALVDARVEPAEVDAALAKLGEAEHVTPPRCRLSQVFVRTEEEAARVAQKLRASPQSFETVAREHSVAPEAEHGGDLGWIEVGRGLALFDEICTSSLKPGQISPVVPSEYGFHVFRLVELEPSRVVDEATLRYRVETALRARAIAEAERRFVTRVRESYATWIDEALVASLEGGVWQRDLERDLEPRP
jgi:peptidyl-prolyl cis-trans isomerase C